jgi:hypothetical protein
MVRILTTHRVFPAKVTGGNGIAGTSVVPELLLKEYAHGCEGCNDFRFCIKRLDLAGLNDGMVVCPGLLEAMRQQFDGLGAVRIPDQEASCCCAKSAYHPKNISHFIDLLPSDAGCWKYDARCETDAANSALPVSQRRLSWV